LRAQDEKPVGDFIPVKNLFPVVEINRVWDMYRVSDLFPVFDLFLVSDIKWVIITNVKYFGYFTDVRNKSGYYPVRKVGDNMPVVVMASPKGGVGKSTCAVLLATEFARMGASPNYSCLCGEGGVSF
jgi:hypothetical protein